MTWERNKPASGDIPSWLYSTTQPLCSPPVPRFYSVRSTHLALSALLIAQGLSDPIRSHDCSQPIPGPQRLQEGVIGVGRGAELIGRSRGLDSPSRHCQRLLVLVHVASSFAPRWAGKAAPSRWMRA